MGFIGSVLWKIMITTEAPIEPRITEMVIKNHEEA